jgi:hypothetical protein
MTECGGF